MTKRTPRNTRVNSASLSRVRSSATLPLTNPEQLHDQYQYVIEDLKRIGLIAVTLIGGLVVLSFFLK